MARSDAPWTPEQVVGLNAWQACGWVHPFTCTYSHTEPRDRVLVAEENGWRCPSCAYRQTWAHDFMLNGAPPHPMQHG
jgi:hypothetical protein